MTKWVLISLMSASTLALSTPAFSQTTQPQTDQTDQSEEDWRRSQRKSGTRDIYRTPNTSSDGFGPSIGEVEPLRKVDTLPRESRRHVMRERAKVIAESDDGTLSDAEFEPSDAAQSDEDLARQEQEAWDELVADTQSGANGDTRGESGDPTQTDQAGPSQGNSQGESQPQDQASSQPRGGSSRSLQEIMNSIKGSPAGSAQSGQTSDDGEQSDSASTAQASESADAGGSAQSDGAEGDDGDGAQSGGSDGAAGQQEAGSDSAQTSADLSPLDYLRQRREEREATGQKRSASDYIQITPQSGGRFEDETEG